jgi:hypothetical protein
MEDLYELNDKDDSAFTNKQFIDATNYYIEAAKNGHPNCTENMYLIDVLRDKVVEELEKAKSKSLKLYFKDQPIIQHDEESTINPIFSK